MDENVNSPRPKLVGNFIRSRREILGLSQRALGQLFTPAVTTQFISNVERGVTPLPPNHVATLARALQISEDEILRALELEYAAKLSGKIPGRTSEGNLGIKEEDWDWFKRIYESFRNADSKAKTDFQSACENILKVGKSKIPDIADKSHHA